MRNVKFLLRILKIQKIGGLILSLAVCQGCCGRPQMTCVSPPPQALLRPCAAPEAGEMQTNEDLVIYTSRLIEAFKTCSARIEAIKEYYNE